MSKSTISTFELFAISQGAVTIRPLTKRPTLLRNPEPKKAIAVYEIYRKKMRIIYFNPLTIARESDTLFLSTRETRK
jgi:hypothetical protein